MKIPTLEQFTKTMTNGAGRKERRFIEKYGDVTFEEAYKVYVTEIKSMLSTNDKINDFERFLINLGAKEIQSNVSESRYYQWNGKKYRFSSHIYPTGSMTSEFCIDLAADPELIHTIEY